MSLLIKALDHLEKTTAGGGSNHAFDSDSLTLALANDHAEKTAYVKPIKSTPSTQTLATEFNQKAAAKVFVANQSAKAPNSKLSLFILAVIGTLLILLGMQAFRYFQTATLASVVVVKPNDLLAPQAVPSTIVPEVKHEASLEPVVIELPAANSQIDESYTSQASAAVFSHPVTKMPNKSESAKTESQQPLTLLTPSAIKDNSDSSARASVKNEAESKPMQLTSKIPAQGVDATLMAAYEALVRGEDANAQQQYRQVLQRDVRNVDALLGMAAIAQRQGRDADMLGWCQKVLELEPRNMVALSMIAGANHARSASDSESAAAESHIKNLLAQQPEAAHLHATLGNLYTEQGQWTSAQQAYFDASRLAPNNADYAFNLAVSLDQIGKPSLALKHYQRALALLNNFGSSSIDRAVLESRIQALQ